MSHRVASITYILTRALPDVMATIADIIVVIDIVINRTGKTNIC